MNTEEIIEGYLGSTIVNSIYQGSELVWPEKYFGNRYMIGGWFNTPKNKIIRLNDNDSIDHTWYNDSNASGGIYGIAYDNINKKIYAGGSNSFEGGLVRYNLDGTKDTSFNIGSGFNSIVQCIKIYNSKIYVGGWFSTFNGNTQNRLARLNMDGSLDTSFNIGTGFDREVNDIKIYNNKIYVGGNFTKYKDSTQNKLIRLNMNGSKDTSFNIGFDYSVQTINLDIINQKIYVGGGFTTFNGYTTENKLIRLNMDGSKDTSFNIGTGFDGTVYVINLDTINQKLYVGGWFSTFRGSTQNSLIRLNMDGTKDTSFNIGTGFDPNPYDKKLVNILIDHEKNKIYIGGVIFSYNGKEQRGLVRLNMNGSLDTSFDLQLNSDVRTILKYTE